MTIRSEIEPDRAPRVSAGRELDIGGLGRRLGRRKRWIIIPAAVSCALAVAFVSMVQPRYTADAKVIVENGESYFTRPDRTDLQQQLLPDDEAVQSQVQLISSRDIAREAIRRLNLKGNPEFDPLAKGLDPISRLLVLFGLEQDPTSVAPEDRMLQAYYDRLMVFSVVKTRVITIEFTATDPDLASRAANTIAELYIETESGTKRDRAKAAADSLGALIEDLRSRSADADAKADVFRSQNGLLVGTNNNTITSQQLADISTQLAQSRTAEADAQAKAKLIRDMIRQGRIGEVPDVANNELIRRISEQRVTLRTEMAQQARTLLPGHPRMQELSAQLADVDNQLRMAAEKAVRTLENDARIATSRVENLSAALDVQKKTASTAGADQVQLNTLELQARLLKEQLEFNTSKYQEALARVSAASTPADARVISKADPPQFPSFPKKLPIILIATFAGLILSTGILVARELLSGRAFAAEDGGDYADAPPLPHEIGLRPALSEAPIVAEPPPRPLARPILAVPVVADPRLGRQQPSSASDPMAATAPAPAPSKVTTESVPASAVPGLTAMPLRPSAEPESKAAPSRTVEPIAAPAREPASRAVAVPEPSDAEQLVRTLEALRDATNAPGALRIMLTSSVRRRYLGPAALGLARRIAHHGRTILVDFDRMMPAVLASNVAAPATGPHEGTLPGLSELTSGDASFAEIIHRDSHSRLHVVPVGNAELPAEGDDTYRLVLEALAETYDYVLLHLPVFGESLARSLVVDTDAVVVIAEDLEPADLKRVRADIEAEAAGPVFVAAASALIPDRPSRDAA